jgi:uroporphyrin-III C-methyltransferase/precorrin-2 dehydrogenase/sirohydrochlorin ferrochelatase
VHVVAPDICDEMAAVVATELHGGGDVDARHGGATPVVAEATARDGRRDAVRIAKRRFVEADLDDVWLVVAAATPDANREVAMLAEPRRLFVNAVDDPPNATAYLSGVVRRDGVTLAISTSGDAPALTSLVREGLDALLPRELAAWIGLARSERVVWRRDGVAMEDRKPRLLRALNELYQGTAGHAALDALGIAAPGEPVEPAPSSVAVDRAPRVPWLNGPEDSWL